MLLGPVTRREMLSRLGTGLGVLGLANVLRDQGDLAHAAGNPLAPKLGHFAPKAKHIIHLFMNGGPSQVDTFDPKPELRRRNGQQQPMGNLMTERRTGALMASPFKFHR